MKAMLLAVVLVLGLGGGCGLFKETEVEVCYIHPKYGVVCVKVGGNKYKLERPDLTLEERAEVEDWLKSQP